jgi:hypothetical protein
MMTKDEEKKIAFFMKTIAKQVGYKSISNSFYKKRQNGLHILSYVVTSKGFTCYSWIKEDRLDDVLWDVMDMPENKAYRYSIHVNGAFAAPSIFVSEYFYDSVDNYEQVVNELWNSIERDLNSFMNQQSLEQILFSKENLNGSEQIIKCLYYIDKGQINEAVDIAKAEMSKGNRGMFSNKGMFFYERVINLL